MTHVASVKAIDCPLHLTKSPKIAQICDPSHHLVQEYLAVKKKKKKKNHEMRILKDKAEDSTACIPRGCMGFPY